MNVALYLRFSCSKQQELSIEGQRKVCEDFCIREGHKIVREYIDRSTSASKDLEKRVQFNQMLKDSKSFDAVLVYALDRFSRNSYDMAICEKELEKNHCKLLSATETNDPSAQGFLMRGILKDMAVYYSMELSAKVKRGMDMAKSKHLYTGGIVPFGYKIVNKQYTLDPTTSPIAKEIFQRIADGEPLLDIAIDLNKRHISTATGGLWNKNSFHRMIENEKYIGTYTYTINGIEYSDEDAIPRIISNQLFYKCQNVSQGRKTKMGKRFYLLSGKVYYHDQVMYGTTNYSKGKEFSYYYLEENKKKRYIKASLLENQVFETLSKLIDEDFIDEICEQALEENEKQKNSPYVKQLEKDIKAKETELKGVINLASNGFDDYLSERYKVLQQEIKELKAELEQEQYLVGFKIDLEQLKEFFMVLLSTKAENKEFKQMLTSTLIKKVILHEDNTFELELVCDFLPKVVEKSPMVVFGRQISTCAYVRVYL